MIRTSLLFIGTLLLLFLRDLELMLVDLDIELVPILEQLQIALVLVMKVAQIGHESLAEQTLLRGLLERKILLALLLNNYLQPALPEVGFGSGSLDGNFVLGLQVLQLELLDVRQLHLPEHH